MSLFSRIFAGACGGVSEAVLAVTPIETLKTRVTDDMRRGTKNYSGSLDAVVKIMKNEGPGGLYRGVVPTIAKQATNQAVRFPTQFYVLKFMVGDDKERRGARARPPPPPLRPIRHLSPAMTIAAMPGGGRWPPPGLGVARHGVRSRPCRGSSVAGRHSKGTAGPRQAARGLFGRCQCIRPGRPIARRLDVPTARPADRADQTARRVDRPPDLPTA